MSTAGDELRRRGEEILERHRELQESLAEIQWTREMTVNWDGDRAKPRFEQPYRPLDDLTEVLQHLQNIWDFLSRYNYYFDEKVISFFYKDTRRSDKSSVIFLLEHDVWETDEVYGDYLIEREGNSLNVSYYRREQRRRTRTIPLLEGDKLNDWLMEDARKQIREAFLVKWSLLELEIETCIEGLHLRPVEDPLTDKELLEQLEEGERLVDTSPEIAMLVLGRVAELWGLLALGQEQKRENQRLLDELRKSGKIDCHQKKQLNKIRILYNSVKHKVDFRSETDEVRDCYRQFRKVFQ